MTGTKRFQHHFSLCPLPSPQSRPALFLARYYNNLQILPISILASLQRILHCRQSCLPKMDKNLSHSVKCAKQYDISFFLIKKFCSKLLPCQATGISSLNYYWLHSNLTPGLTCGPRAISTAKISRGLKHPCLGFPLVTMEILPPQASGPGAPLPPGLAGTQLWA